MEDAAAPGFELAVASPAACDGAAKPIQSPAASINAERPLALMFILAISPFLPVPATK
jgi:hypothetical protein